MNLVAKVGNVLTRYVALIIIALSIWAYLTPNLFAWATGYTSIFLGIIMFGMGLTISPNDFKVVFTHPKEVVLGAILQYTIMPMAAWGLAVGLNLPTDIALGVILVGCCPGGTASNVITYIAKGDVPLSVGMTIVSTLLAPIATPALVYWLAGAWVNVSFTAMLISVVQIVLIPVIAGILVNAFASKAVQKCTPILPCISVLAIALIVAGITANNTEKIIESGALVLAVVMLHNAVGMGLGYAISRAFKLNYAKTTAVAIEVGMQNSGLAVSLAAANFAANPLATLPGAIFSIWHNIAGSIFANVRRRRIDGKDASFASTPTVLQG
ncbi:MAG: bile acid:sodium symporter family protein [Eggerthellaceae bacterium]|jgi:BASS family bile acid:Na+ symporter